MELLKALAVRQAVESIAAAPVNPEDFAYGERFRILTDTFVSREFKGRLEDMKRYNTVQSGKLKYGVSPAGKAAK